VSSLGTDPTGGI